MLEFASPRIIRLAEARDLEPLKKVLPKQDPGLHAERLAMQGRGEAAYLLAVQDDVPVGRLLLKWAGSTVQPIPEDGPVEETPDIEDLFVHEEHRNRNVGSRLLEKAEELAAEHGYKKIGFAFGAEDASGRELYEKRGYVDSGLSPFKIGGKYTDADGKEQDWHEEVVYFVRPLTPAAATETENKMNSDEQTGTETPEAAGETAPAAEARPGNEKPLTDQVVDFAFGVALTAAEVLEKAVETLGEKAKIVQKEAPAVWEAMQDKGRPAREKLVQSLREETKEETEAATAAKTTVPAGDVVFEPDAPVTDTTAATDTVAPPAPVTPPATVTPPIKPASRLFGFGRSSSLSAEDEIRALEDRVKTLEREVAVTPAPVAPTLDETAAEAGPSVVSDAAILAAPTPAEETTAQVEFEPRAEHSDALTDSPYAVMDDEERSAVPTQAGAYIETAEPEADATPAAPKAKRTKKAIDVAGETTEATGTEETEEPAA